MTAPFAAHDVFTAGQELAIAVALGFCFGFFLERAGFGSAKKLTSQFYFDDMRVLKVMFTAIITAMTGLWLLSAAGWLDLSEVYVVPTYLAPQFVGGLLLGAGFIVGGYCPGTSIVGFATGRVDALMFALGILGGLAIYAAAYPAIAGFAESTSLGEALWPELLGVPRGVLTAGVVAMAVALFYGATKVEGMMRKGSSAA